MYCIKKSTMRILKIILLYISLFALVIFIDQQKIFGVMFSESKDYAGALAAIYISILSIGGLSISYQISQSNVYNETVTKSRLEWLAEVRNEVKIFFELTVDQQNKLQKIKKEDGLDNIGGLKSVDRKFKDDFYSNSAKIKASSNILATYFNPNDTIDVSIIDQVNRITVYISEKKHKTNDSDDFRTMCQDLSKSLSIYFKDEWEKIKEDSQ